MTCSWPLTTANVSLSFELKWLTRATSQHGRALADARCDALDPADGCQLGGERPGQRPDVGLRLSGEALDLVERAVQAIGFDRLQQVVDRIHGEGLERVAVVRGGEDHRHVALEPREQLEAGEARHGCRRSR
jgi:hypothetical protein